MTFADKLTAPREKAGLTPKQLAERTGVPLATVKRLEAGANKRVPAWGVVARLAAGVGVPCRVFSACWQSIDDEYRRGSTRSVAGA